MAAALKSARDVVQSQGVGVIVYAEGTTAGWEAILGAIIDSNWIVTSSWPIDTEMENRTQAQGSASLQSSIHHHVLPPARKIRTARCARTKSAIGATCCRSCPAASTMDAALGRGRRRWRGRHLRLSWPGSGNLLPLFTRGESQRRGRHAQGIPGAGLGRRRQGSPYVIFTGADTTGFEDDARLTAMWLWTLNAANGKMETAE